MTRSAYEGQWRRLRNLSAGTAGVVHDDAVARTMGFEGGLVPGNIVATAAMPAVVDAFGEDWMRGGWYSLRFIEPVYEHDEVRESAWPEAGREEVAIAVETRTGRTCCVGRAGLGTRTPWDERDGAGADASVLPGLAIDSGCGEATLTVTHESIAALLEAAGDRTPWYRESSPLGPPLVPPERFVAFALQMTAACGLGPTVPLPGVRPPWMWSEHSVVISQPPLLDRPYIVSQRIAEKGRSRRTVYLTLEFQVRDPDEGPIAIGRHSLKWFPSDGHGSEAVGSG